MNPSRRSCSDPFQKVRRRISSQTDFEQTLKIIIDPDFRGTNRAERSQAVWKYLDLLPDEAVADISTVLLLTPDETKNSFANMEFDEPIPSKL